MLDYGLMYLETPVLLERDWINTGQFHMGNARSNMLERNLKQIPTGWSVFTRLAFLVLTIAFLFSASAHADNGKAALRDKLDDLQTLIESGIDYREYSNHVSELLLLQRRYQKNGGTENGLLYAVEAYVKARNVWNDKIADSDPDPTIVERHNELADKQIQIYWDLARREIQYQDDDDKERGKRKK
jgi:hypothetical protein